MKTVDKQDDQIKVDKNNATQYYQKHIPNSFGIKFNCVHPQFSEKYTHAVLKDPNELQKTFVEQVEEYAHKAYALTQQHKNEILWKSNEAVEHKNALMCYECGCDFDKNDKAKYKVAHHDHITGDFISSCCNTCNLKYQYKKFLPIYCHN